MITFRGRPSVTPIHPPRCSRPLWNAERGMRSAEHELRITNYADALMEARKGSGWNSPAATADALWALSRYAIVKGEKPQSGQLTLTLGDRPIQATALAGNPG